MEWPYWILSSHFNRQFLLRKFPPEISFASFSYQNLMSKIQNCPTDNFDLVSFNNWMTTSGPNFRELLNQKILLSKNKQDTSYNLYLWHGNLAGNLILESIILFRLETLYAYAALWNLGLVVIHWMLFRYFCLISYCA